MICQFLAMGLWDQAAIIFVGKCLLVLGEGCGENCPQPPPLAGGNLQEILEDGRLGMSRANLKRDVQL